MPAGTKPVPAGDNTAAGDNPARDNTAAGANPAGANTAVRDNTAARTLPEGFDPGRPYALDAQVALRPEPFGALAYHYGNRRLTFVRAPELVHVLKTLRDHDSADAALAASTVPPTRWPAFRAALASLARSEVIRAR